jgi:glycerophosphoryl diester phosphodiesterase
MTAAEHRRVAFKATADRMIALGELCEFVAGRATLVIELKSRFDDRRLAAPPARCSPATAGRRPRVVRCGADRGAARGRAGLPRGLVAQRGRRRNDRPMAAGKRAFGHALRAHPQFIAYSVTDLPAALPMIACKLFGLPLLNGAQSGSGKRRNVTPIR